MNTSGHTSIVHLKREQELVLPICYIRLKADATVMNTCSQLEKCWLKVEICQGRAGWGCCWQAGAPLSGGRYLSTGFRPPTIIIVKKSCSGCPSQCLGFISSDTSSVRHHVTLVVRLHHFSSSYHCKFSTLENRPILLFAIQRDDSEEKEKLQRRGHNCVASGPQIFLENACPLREVVKKKDILRSGWL